MPHTQTCGRTIGAPRRKPTAMRIVALSIFRPILDYGSATSQSPEHGERDARRRARSTSVADDYKSIRLVVSALDLEPGDPGSSLGVAHETNA
jgi:hypothetical protein